MHAALLLLGAALILLAQLQWELFQNAPAARDKQLHYHVGRFAAAGVFYLAYIGIVVRVLIVGRVESSMTATLLWVPMLLAVALALALGGAILLAYAKEALDMGGAGMVDAGDVEATVDGALTLVFPVGIIMALTPALIPLDVIMQLPRLAARDARSGFGAVDQYLRAQRQHRLADGGADVLLLEDDIVCATTVLNFCANLDFACHHVSTVLDADQYLRANALSIQLVICDNFVRVDRYGSNATGLDWLRQLMRDYPAARRRFALVMISGHTEFLSEAEACADLVLKKPWRPTELLAFMQTRGMVEPKRG